MRRRALIKSAVNKYEYALTLTAGRNEKKSKQIQDVKELINNIHDSHRELGDKVAKLSHLSEHNSRHM